MKAGNISTVCIATVPLEFGGGIIREVSLLTEYLAERGIEVSMITAHNAIPGLFMDESTKPFGEVKTERMIRPRSYFPLYCLTSLFEGLLLRNRLPKADLYLAIGSSSLEAAPLALSGVPYTCIAATTFRNEWRSVGKLTDLRRPVSWALRVVNSLTSPLTRLLEGHCYRKAAAIHAISRFTRRCIEEEFGIEGITIVHPWLDDACFEEREPVIEGAYLFSVGRLDPRKELPMMVAAFAKSGYGGRLVIAGTGPMKEAAEAAAEKHGMASRVDLIGYVTDEKKYALLQHADAFLLSSSQEGFGITVIEAMANRTPVVSTRCGGPEEVVEDGVTGFLADVGDIEGFASAIDKAVSGGNEEMVAKALEIAKKHKVEALAKEIAGLEPLLSGKD